MDPVLDRSLDEILADRKQNNRGSRGGGGRRRERSDYPRDGARKPFRDDAPRDLDSEWVHDRFEGYGGRRPAPRRRQSPEPISDIRGTKLRVDNIHYELTQEDLEGLFRRIGPVLRVEMKYDRAGRSEGIAFVTYEYHRDAVQAIKEFDGANAAGQPIRLTLLPSGPRRSNNSPFDAPAGRPLAERITKLPPGRSRSLSPLLRGSDDESRGRRRDDRYRPGGISSRSRSPLPGRRRDGGGGGGSSAGGPGRRRRDGGGGRRGGERGRDGRPRKTQEELDAEMEDYFAAGGAQQQQQEQPQNGAANGGFVDPAVPAAAPQPASEDVDMIE